ncbi:MAG: HAD family hydrolase [Candidatus Tectimicrobiota bacterium]
MIPAHDAILFDFDGTLAIQTLDFAAIRERLLTFTVSHGLSQAMFHGLDILEMLAHATMLLGQQHVALGQRYTQAAAQLLQEMEVESARSSGLLPGVEELLRTLQQERIGVGIVTRNCDAAVRVAFPHVDVYCQVFVPRDRVTRVKPHPAHLQAALEALGLPPERALMVGDGAMDMQAGKALGMFSIGVLTGSSSRATLLAQGADLVLDSVADLRQYVLQRPRALL